MPSKQLIVSLDPEIPVFSPHVKFRTYVRLPASQQALILTRHVSIGSG